LIGRLTEVPLDPLCGRAVHDFGVLDRGLGKLEVVADVCQVNTAASSILLAHNNGMKKEGFRMTKFDVIVMFALMC
jgi:hypothetical protein